MRRTVPSIAIFLTGCVGEPVYMTDSSFCDRLSDYAATVPKGESRTVKLIRGGRWLVDHYKTCQSEEGDAAGKAYCEWLMENTSTEFMEANVNRALSCLQGQKIQGMIGNTGVSYWAGEALFDPPASAVGDVRIELKYAVDYRDDGDVEDFISITVVAE